MNSRDLFEILVRENADMLTVYLRSVVRDETLVDDLFQETMLTAWRVLDRFDRRRPFGPWLRGIAAKLILAQHRKRRKSGILCDHNVLEHLDVRLAALQRRPGDTFEEKLDGLRQCIEALPDRYREAVKLRYFEQMQTANVAARLSITVEALKKRLQRARARLWHCLERKLSPTGAIS